MSVQIGEIFGGGAPGDLVAGVVVAHETALVVYEFGVEAGVFQSISHIEYSAFNVIFVTGGGCMGA